MEETSLPEAGVRPWLEKTFGVSVHAEMAQQDADTHATYYSAAELENYRLRFVNGIVYTKKWWENSPHLALFDTASQIRAHPKALAYLGDHDTTGGVRELCTHVGW